jgi:hypothetical protein
LIQPTQTIEQRFAQSLTKALKEYYRGRLPSFSVIARDFALRAPHLNHLSGETIRNWVRGTSLPHFSRMQVLEEWLGVNFTQIDQFTTHKVEHAELPNGQWPESHSSQKNITAPEARPIDFLNQIALNAGAINSSPAELIGLVKVLHALNAEQQSNVLVAIENIIKVSNYLKLLPKDLTKDT